MMKIQAFMVDQWMKDWDKTQFLDNEFKSKPPKEFYIFKINAKKLLELSGIYRRSLKDGKNREGVQREHEGGRLSQIEGYVREGYPLSKIKKEKRQSGDEEILRRPGWLPTSIVINILKKDDQRYGKKVDADRLISIKSDNSETFINIPDKAFTTNEERSSQKAAKLNPIEVIDGQHRLLSFNDFTDDELENFYLPVVAFWGLDIGWQAYLFWTINICPKKISPSLAYDLYPLLRSQEWIEKEGNHKIYIEARSQEIVDYLWMNKKSAWKDRIDMIGSGYDYPSISQSTFIRSLTTSFFKKVSGFFMSSEPGAKALDINLQAAVVIYCWNNLRERIDANKNLQWIEECTKEPHKCPKGFHPAFASDISLLSQDQGIKVINDLFSSFLKLTFTEYEEEMVELVSKEESAEEIVNFNLKELNNSHKFIELLSHFNSALCHYDFRSSKATLLSDDQRKFKQSLRGGSGYQILKKEVLKIINQNCDASIKHYSEMLND